MEAGDWRIFLSRDWRLPRLEPVWVTGLLGACFAFAAVAAPEPEDPVADDSTPIYAEPARKVVKIADIDTENFEIGVAAGLLSVEDFETNPVTIATLSYHVTEDFFAQARFGQSDVGESSFETLSGGAQLLADDDRSLSFYDLSLGVNLLPGEAFLWNRWAMNSSLFLIGGVGSTQFAGSDRLTVNAGVGYRVILKDFVTLNVSLRDHMFDSEVTGKDKQTHNFEFSAGISVFF